MLPINGQGKGLEYFTALGIYFCCKLFVGILVQIKDFISFLIFPIVVPVVLIVVAHCGIFKHIWILNVV